MKAIIIGTPMDGQIQEYPNYVEYVTQRSLPLIGGAYSASNNRAELSRVQATKLTIHLLAEDLAIAFDEKEFTFLEALERLFQGYAMERELTERLRQTERLLQLEKRDPSFHQFI